MPNSSLKGSREGQEDYSNMFRNTRYAAVYGCDGHGGAVVADTFGDFFHTNICGYLESLSNDSDINAIRDELIAIYYRTIEHIDSLEIKGGCTFSAGILQIHTGLFITIQVGDSKIMVINPKSGKMAEGELISIKDYASPAPEIICAPGLLMEVVTQTHDFGRVAEIARYQEYLKSTGSRTLKVKPKQGAPAKEKRFEASVHNGFKITDLVEPSRTIENRSFYNTEPDLQALQNPPETMIWRLDTNQTTAIAFFCDGFESKFAIPSNERIASLISDPGAYIMNSDIVSDTILGGWLCTTGWWPAGPIKKTICGSDWSPSEGEYVKPSDVRFATRPFLYVSETLLGIAPDAEWQQAVVHSLGELTRMHDAAIADGRDCIPSLLDDAETAVIAATHVPVLLASDDNVTLEVQII